MPLATTSKTGRVSETPSGTAVTDCTIAWWNSADGYASNSSRSFRRSSKGAIPSWDR